MPDEMSPEEKLLRLIKGEQNSAKPKPQDAPLADGSAKEPEQPSSNEQNKNTAPEKTEKATDKDKKSSPENDAQQYSTRRIDSKIKENIEKDKNLETFKESLKKKETMPAEKKDDSKKIKNIAVPSAETAVSSDKTEQPVATPEEKNQTEPSETPENKTEHKKNKPKENFFAGVLRFIISGFNSICWILLLLLLLSIGATVWHTRNVSLREYTVPDIIISKQTQTQTETSTALKIPNPFPYYAEQISSKQLFKLVQPPPPPKPPEPEKKEPEKPKVKIETLTRNFVLQGIVYDIGPPQAIIFDKKDNKTMFLGNEEMLTESVKIKKILRGKVILEYEDQTQEMTF